MNSCLLLLDISQLNAAVGSKDWRPIVTESLSAQETTLAFGLAHCFWNVCIDGEWDKQAWCNLRRIRRLDITADESAHSLRWLVEYLRAWLLICYGMNAYEGSNELCMAAFEKTKAVFNEGQDYFSRSMFTHCLPHNPGHERAPALTPEEFGQICRGGHETRVRMFAALVHDREIALRQS